MINTIDPGMSTDQILMLERRLSTGGVKAIPAAFWYYMQLTSPTSTR
jgi:hypothetical protein